MRYLCKEASLRAASESATRPAVGFNFDMAVIRNRNQPRQLSRTLTSFPVHHLRYQIEMLVCPRPLRTPPIINKPHVIGLAREGFSELGSKCQRRASAHSIQDDASVKLLHIG